MSEMSVLREQMKGAIGTSEGLKKLMAILEPGQIALAMSLYNVSNKGDELVGKRVAGELVRSLTDKQKSSLSSVLGHELYGRLLRFAGVV